MAAISYAKVYLSIPIRKVLGWQTDRQVIGSRWVPKSTPVVTLRTWWRHKTLGPKLATGWYYERGER